MKQALYAVGLEHHARRCPLAQSGPEMAKTLADNLETANLVGVFAMPAHKGVALVEAASPTAVTRVCARVLPNHLPPQVKRVPADSVLQSFYIHPERLENAPNSVRLGFLAAAALLFPQMGLEAAIKRQLPSLSLRSLPAFLRQHAPRQRLLL